MKKITPRQIKLIHTLVSRLGLDEETYRDMLEANFCVRSSKELMEPEAAILINTLQAKAVEMGVWKRNRKKYDHLAQRPGTYATPAQLRLLESLWLQVSRARDPHTALQNFIRKKFGIGRLEWLDRKTAAKAIYVVKQMIQNKKEKA